MIKVLHLISGGDVGGAKTHVLTLVKELSKEIPVKIICFMEGTFADEAREMGIDIQVICQKQRYDLKVVDELIEIIHKGEFNLIHSHGARANFITRFIKRKLDIPCVTTVHSDFMLDFKGNIYKHLIYTKLNVFALKRFDYFIAVSEDFRQMLIGRGFPQEKIYTVYNGIDFDKNLDYEDKETFLKEQNLEHLKDGILFGILARLHPVKGHEIFIKAAERIIRKNREAHFLIAGDGEEMASLRNLSREMDIESNIHFLGFVDKPYDFLNAIDINVLTSYSESFPYVLLEGARLKKPTIASAVGGIPMLIEDGENGYTFKAGDDLELFEKMDMILKDDERRKTLGNNLNRKAVENYSLKNLASSHMEIYKALIKDFKKKAKVVISGYYGFGNSGDEAILKSIVRDFREYNSDVAITALSNDPQKTQEEYNINAINRMNIKDIVKELKTSDLFISGGGSLLQDQTSTRSLLYYLYIIKLAQRYGKKTMLYANGIGPINSQTNIKRVKDAINQVDLITLREEDSFNFLKTIGINKPRIELTADPVLTTKSSQNGIIDEIFEKEGIHRDSRLLGVNAREWKWSRGLEAKLAESLEYAYNEYGLVSIFMPMSKGDIGIMEEISQLMETPFRVLGHVYEPEELIGMMEQMELVIAMRLHTLVYSSIATTPMLGLIYDPKIKGYLDYISQYAAGSVENIESSTINDKIDMIMNNYNHEKNKLIDIMEGMKALAKENVKLAFTLMEGELGE